MPTDGASASRLVVQRACEARARQGGARQLRLLMAACARRVQHLVPWPALRELIGLAERAADGKASPLALRHEHERGAALEQLEQGHDADASASLAAHVCLWAVTPKLSWHLAGASLAAGWHAEWRAGLAEDDSLPPRGRRARRRRAQAAWLALLDDLFPGPAPAFALEAGWRTPTVDALIANVHDEGDYSLAPILADALEDAGCSCVALLEHLRWHPAHVRGCWAVERLLGRR